MIQIFPRRYIGEPPIPEFRPFIAPLDTFDSRNSVWQGGGMPMHPASIPLARHRLPGEPAILAPSVYPVISELIGLAPQFRSALIAGLQRCEAAGLDVIPWETLRTDARQRYLYTLGRSVTPPPYTVTNSATAQASWHYYGLAADCISKTHRWAADPAWWAAMGDCMEAEGLLSWGGHWKRHDSPHVQWKPCRQSPSSESAKLCDVGGLQAVWAAVNAA